MKKILAGVVVATLLLSTIIEAAPERTRLIDERVYQKRKLSKQGLEYFDTNDIKDPAAREAIEHIVNYLGLRHMQSRALDREIENIVALKRQQVSPNRMKRHKKK